jgi:DNA helicase-2/ATP-dependent DNA helicase PcrA
MEFMIENAVNIHDEVLQQELSKSADDKMKNIVATIQRDQNAVIRNETTPVMIIQGVAGSGKTSIALHRIAFLLISLSAMRSGRETF